MKDWTWAELASGVRTSDPAQGWLPRNIRENHTSSKWIEVLRGPVRTDGVSLFVQARQSFACVRLMTAMYCDRETCRRVLKMQPDDLARFYQIKPAWAALRGSEPLWAHLVGALYGDAYAAADALMHRVPCMAGMYRAVFDLPRLTRLTEMYAPDRATIKILFASVFNRTNPSRTQVAEWLNASYVAWSMNREVG